MNQILDLAGSVGGRTHPMVLHLPIGLIVGLVALELWWLLRRSKPDRTPRILIAWLAALSALVAAGSGLLLSQEDSYTAGNATLDLHKWLGIACAGAFLVVAIIASITPATKIYRFAMVTALALIVPVGHLGASMTHGPDFLWEAFERRAPSTPNPTPPVDEPATALTASPAVRHYDANIQPILTTYCTSCHGPSRQRGGLALDTPERMQRGGLSGPVLVPGDPATSPLIIRMRLPLADEDHMPPEPRRQPSAAEIDAVAQWIAAGARFDAPAAEGIASARPAINDQPAGPDAPARALPAASPAAIAALRARFIHIEPLDPAAETFFVDASNAADPGDNAAALLAPLADHIAELRLRGWPVSLQTAERLAAMPQLHALDLSNANLEAGALEALGRSASLARLNLWGTGVTAARAASLATDRLSILTSPGAVATLPPPEIIETEPEVAFTPYAPGMEDVASGDRPTPDVGPAAPPLVAVNAVCPVSGAPVVAKFTIVHEGRAIGFCCEKCALAFWSEPGKYPTAVSD